MKAFILTAVLIMSCAVCVHGQLSSELLKVESPYRFLKGLSLKTDLTIIAPLPSVANHKKLAQESGQSDLSLSQEYYQLKSWEQKAMIVQNYYGQPAVFIDGILYNVNWQSALTNNLIYQNYYGQPALLNGVLVNGNWQHRLLNPVIFQRAN